MISLYADYDRGKPGQGWEVFDAISGRTLVYVPFKWAARLVCWAIDRRVNGEKFQ